MKRDEDFRGNFYEDDEDEDLVNAVFDASPKFVTAPPLMMLRFVDQSLNVSSCLRRGVSSYGYAIHAVDGGEPEANQGVRRESQPA